MVGEFFEKIRFKAKSAKMDIYSAFKEVLEAQDLNSVVQSDDGPNDPYSHIENQMECACEDPGEPKKRKKHLSPSKKAQLVQRVAMAKSGGNRMKKEDKAAMMEEFHVGPRYLMRLFKMFRKERKSHGRKAREGRWSLQQRKRLRLTVTCNRTTMTSRIERLRKHWISLHQQYFDS